MNTFSNTIGSFALQAQPRLNIYPSPYTTTLPPVIIKQWVWLPTVSETPPSSRIDDEDVVERVGHIYASLADEDVALAEMGLDEYARLLDHELVDVPIPSPTVNE
jgi:hypothetical protein